ncbi:MAG: hypothetical protein QXX35_00635 [Desulfurococcaceae archaeon]|uniref:Uncharacterized protein n=1 Tax=Staphylothermus marinus TaxID=2280 RepID=A0A7C4H9W0_STAMA
MNNNFDKIINRFLEIMKNWDKKYVDYLEETIILEAELMSIKDKNSIERALLYYVDLVKKIIVDELGISYDFEKPYMVFNENILGKTIEIEIH